jgi:hypothetical protein
MMPKGRSVTTVARDIFQEGDLLIDTINGRRGIITGMKKAIIQVKWEKDKKQWHRLDGIVSEIAGERVLWSPVKRK